MADTAPLRYLVLIRRVGVLPRLFAGVSVTATVIRELSHARSPRAVSMWASAPPAWLALHADPAGLSLALPGLDRGERSAILLAEKLDAGLLLMDDRAGVTAARTRGLRVVGTLGVLAGAASEGLLDLVEALAALRATNFRAPESLFELLLAEDRARRAGKSGGG